MKCCVSDKYGAFAWGWLLLVSVLTVLEFAPDGLNADILINSVMSLQNLTLYYWGQNRLLNVLPLIVSLVKVPALNLAAVLVLTSMSFYGVLYILCRVSALLVGATNESGLAFKVFLISSSAFVFIFSSAAITDITIGHIEYSFPALLLGFGALKLFRPGCDLQDRRRFILPVAAIFLAIGVNPSTAIFASFMPISFAIYRKRIGLNELVVVLASVISFVVWSLIAKEYGNLQYNEFRLNILPGGLKNVVVNLADTVNMPTLLFLISFFLLVSIGRTIAKDNKNIDFHPVVCYTTHMLILVSVWWLLLFSSNIWVEMNHFHWRYFIYVIYCLILVFTLHLSNYLINANNKKSMALTIVAAFCLIIFLWPQAGSLNFKNYKVFQRVNAVTEPGRRLYAGNYWDVWPSVLRDMINGYDAYGLSYRGEANRESAREYVIGSIKENGYVTVYCLNDRVQNCISQVSSIIGPLFAVSSAHSKEGVALIHFVEHAPFLEFVGPEFLSLPSQVGIIEDLGIKTQSRSGFLVYGPYTPLKSGKYMLSILGRSSNLSGAYVDVVSDKGAKVHAKFGVKQDGNYLLRNGMVTLVSSVNDVEVRVWVSEKDEIKLFGYMLKPTEM